MPQAQLQIGTFKLTGHAATAAILLTLGGSVGLVVWAHPSSSNWPIWVSAALWIAFVAYWSAAARRTAPTVASESVESRRVHERMLNASYLLPFVPIPGLRTQILSHSTTVVVAGLIAQALFLLLAVWARRHLGRNWSGAITTKEEHQLIRSGPYRTIRHPIYTAMLGMFAASAVVSGQTHALLAVALITGAYWRKLRMEERHLQTVFGARYDEYRRHSGAVVPWVL
jgi:protein-S-isoprenylcysteine O-methyltransferase Ste14